MAYQFQPPGVLNRLRASVTYQDFPELNVNSGYLTTEGIRLAIEGNATDLLPAMVSLVSSPAPYLAATLTMSIIRSTPVAERYKLQFEDNTLMGLVTIWPDTDALTSFTLNNVALESIREMAFAGMEAGIVISARGYYIVNSGFFCSA
jgi:hypothetical protein